MANELEQLRLEAEQLKNQIRVSDWKFITSVQSNLTKGIACRTLLGIEYLLCCVTVPNFVLIG